MHAVERGHFEESRRGPVAHGDEDRPELLLERHHLPDERHVVDTQAGAMDVRQSQGLEESESLGGEHGDAARRRQVAGVLEIPEDATQVGGDRFTIGAREGTRGERSDRLPHAVLHLDEVLAARFVARLELQVARHDPLGTGLDGGERCHAGAQITLDRDDRLTAHG